jgi:hypothetical protein
MWCDEFLALHHILLRSQSLVVRSMWVLLSSISVVVLFRRQSRFLAPARFVVFRLCFCSIRCFCFVLLQFVIFALLCSIRSNYFCSFLLNLFVFCSVSVRFPLFPARSCFLFFLFSFLLSSVVGLYFVFLFLCVSLCLCVCIGSENGVALVLGLLLGGGGGCWLQRWLRRWRVMLRWGGWIGLLRIENIN